MIDEYIADMEAKRDNLRLQLRIVMASNIPSSVKNERIEEITRQVVTLKNEILAALRGLHG